jgi:hypothetical protein
MVEEIEVIVENMNSYQCSECLKEIIKFLLFNKNQIPTLQPLYFNFRINFDELKEIKEKVDVLSENKKRITLKDKKVASSYSQILFLFEEIDKLFKQRENEKEINVCIYFGSVLKPIELFFIKFYQSKESKEIKNATRKILRNLISNQSLFESNMGLTKMFLLVQVKEEIEIENFFPKVLKKIEKEFLIKIGKESELPSSMESRIWLISKHSITGFK